MDRRKFLKSVTGVATVAAASTAGADAVTSQPSQSDVAAPKKLSGKRILHTVIAAPDAVQGIADFAHQFAARVRAMTEEALSIDVVEHVDQGLPALQRDEVDGYCASEHAHIDVVRELAFFAGLPGKTALPADAHHNWLTVGGGQRHWDEMSGELGVKPLAIAHTGPTSKLWSQTAIDSVDALAGKTIFAEGLAADVVHGLGAETFSGTNRDLRQAVAGSAVFAAEVGDLPAALAAGLPHALPYATSPGINRFGSVVTFGLKRSVWDSLSASHRLVLESAAAATYHEIHGFAHTHHNMMANASALRHGTTDVTMSKDAEDAISRVSDTVIAHLASSSPRAARINTSYMSFRKTAGFLGA